MKGFDVIDAVFGDVDNFVDDPALSVEVFYCQEPSGEMVRVENGELTNVLGTPGCGARLNLTRAPCATEAGSKGYFAGG